MALTLTNEFWVHVLQHPGILPSNQRTGVDCHGTKMCEAGCQVALERMRERMILIVTTLFGTHKSFVATGQVCSHLLPRKTIFCLIALDTTKPRPPVLMGTFRIVRFSSTRSLAE
jgi:hypothetical protein